jgi:hypothetical protein
MPVTWPLCLSCGNPYSSDEGERYTIVLGCGPDSRVATYADPPYDWHADNGFCLTCWLLCDASWKQSFKNVN